MKLFSRKKSNTAIREDPPAISRPRAQGHLPPTTGPRPANPSRRSFGSTAASGSGSGSGDVTTPLYARFARADSFENISLRAKADSRAASTAPSHPDLDHTAQEMGFERPWARERMGSLDSVRAPPPNPTDSQSSIRMVSNPPSAPTDRKSTADTLGSTTRSKRLSLDAMAAQDPFTASKLQSVLRKAPANVKVPDSEPAPLPKPHPSRSSTAPGSAPTQPNRPNPSSRAPTAPVPSTRSTSTPVSPPNQAPSRATSTIRSVSTTHSRNPPPPPPPVQNYRPSLDGATSDDGMSTFSHSQAGHGSMRPVYPSLATSVSPNGYPNQGSNPPPASSSKRERGPPPVAGTPSAYAWRSGQSDDGHGGSNFYTGGSQTGGPMGLASLPSLPPGAAPPNPSPYVPSSSSPSYGPPNTHSFGPSTPYGPTHGSVPAKKRTPSNPPVSRVPHLSSNTVGSRRMSVDAGAERPLSGGPGTWGGSAIGPAPVAQAQAQASRERERERGRGQEDDRSVPVVRSVQPGEIFQHPQVSVSAPMSVNMSVEPVASSSYAPRGVHAMEDGERGRAARTVEAPIPLKSAGMELGKDSSFKPGATRQAQAQAPHGRTSPTKPLPLESRLAAPPRPQERERWSPMKSFEGRTSPTKQAPEGRVSPAKPSASPLSIDSGSGWSAHAAGGTTSGSARTPGRTSSPARTLGRTSSPSRTLDGTNSSVRTLEGTGSATAGSVRADTPSTGRASTLSPSTPVVPVTPTPSTPVAAATPTPSTPAATFSPSTPVGAGSSLSVPVTASSGRTSFLSAGPVPPVSPVKSTAVAPPSPSKSEVPRSAVSSSPVRTRELPHPPSTHSHPPKPSFPRAPSSVSSYGTAMAFESEAGSEVQAPAPSRLALAGLAPINTLPHRSASPTPTNTSAAPSSAMVTARMTPTTSSARSPMSIPSLLSSTPNRALGLPPRAVSPTPTASTMRLDEPTESDGESLSKKRNLLVKTRKMDAAGSFRSERPVSVVQPGSPGPGLGLSGGPDPFARAPPTIVKTSKKAQAPLTPEATPDPNHQEEQTTPRGAMLLSPPLSSDDHDAYHTAASDLTRRRDEPSPMTPALTDEAPQAEDMDQAKDMEEPEEEEEEEFEPASTTPPGSPPPPKVYPLATHMNMPSLLGALLPHLSFRDWNAINALNSVLRRQLEETRALREEILEFWLSGVGYSRWTAPRREVLPLTLRDLNAYMRGVSIAVYRYSAIAESFLAVRAQQEKTHERVPGAASKGNLVRALASSCRAYTKVILRLREQAENMHPEGDFRSPLFRVGSAPLLRVFVPSKEGAWLSDASVLDCEKELKRAGALGVLRVGDVVWDAAVGDEGNAGRMVWDGNYLVDLDYTYSTTGELPKYMDSLAFSPSYWHKVIRTSNSPLCHFDLAPYAAEIAQNLQLVQDRVQTETPQGGRHTVVRWVHRSRFHPRPGMPIPGSNPPSTVDRMWEGVIVVEVEGTNEGLADLQGRVGHGARLFPAKTAGMEYKVVGGKSPFRLLRTMSRPGEIWIRAVREKERLA